ncbi:MAG: CoA transferase [Chloroflexi bacterium]|nr:CoA transferase [Chloroflexota bacterium]
MLALEGLKIIDLSAGYPGGFATWLLSDLGAEVINIEGRIGARAPVQGKEARRRADYDSQNRNKKSLGLNLKSQEGRAIFYELAKRADVIVEPFRPGVAKRLGIDYPAIVKINPSIIYCSMTGYGQDGPYRDLPGHDVNFLSFAGVLDLIGEPDGAPVIPLNFVGDYAGAAMHAAVGILAAVVARNKTGKGQYIDISYLDTVISLLAQRTTHYFREGILPKRGKMMGAGAYPYYHVYETSDHKYISFACVEHGLWGNLCRALGREDLVSLGFEIGHLYSAPDEKWQKVLAEFRSIFLTRTRDEWFEFLKDKDVAVAKVSSLDDVIADPHVLHRRMIVELEGPNKNKVKQVGIAIKLSDTPGCVRSLAPVPGENSEEILKGLGYDDERIRRLRKDSIIFDRL